MAMYVRARQTKQALEKEQLGMHGPVRQSASFIEVLSESSPHERERLEERLELPEEDAEDELDTAA